VIERHHDLYLVQWDDGADEEVHLGDYERVVTRGSLEHTGLTQPEELRRQFDADPKAVFAQALREGEAMTFKEVRECLVGHGLDAGVVESAWQPARKVLAAAGQITASGRGSAMKYVWSGREAEMPAAASQPVPDPDAAKPDAESEALATPHGGGAAGAQAEAITADLAQPSVDLEAPAVQPPTREEAATPPVPEVETSLEDLVKRERPPKSTEDAYPDRV
jgi:hypothetical protein